MNQNKMVSVIIPTYKRSDKLPRAVKSVLNQTYSNVEVLVVSDNEPNDEFTEQARRIVESFNDPRVKLITQKHHTNGAAARNVGIKASTGEFIAFLDDDDFWDKEKLEIQVPVLESLDSSFGGVSCLNKVFKKGKLHHLQQGYRSGYLYRRILMCMLAVSTDTVVLRREALFDAGLYDESLLRNQEVQLFTFFTSKYKIQLIDKYLCNVDVDDNQNRPTPEKYVKLKHDFFKSVSPIVSKMNWFMKSNIKVINFFEIGGLYALRGEYFKAIKYVLPLFISPIALFSALRRIVRRSKSYKIPNELNGKDLEYFIKYNNLQ